MKNSINWKMLLVCIVLIIIAFSTVRVIGDFSKGVVADDHGYGDINYEDAPDDELIQQVIELLKNPEEHNGEELNVVAQIFKTNDEILMGREMEVSNKMVLYAVEINPTTINLPEDFNSGDWYKVRGKVEGEDEPHGDHSHHKAVINVISLEPTEAPLD